MLRSIRLQKRILKGKALRENMFYATFNKEEIRALRKNVFILKLMDKK